MAGAQLADFQALLNDWSADDSYDGIWQDVTYTRPGTLTLNTSTGIYTQGAATTYSIRAHIERFRLREIDGSTIQPTDLRCGLPPAAVAQFTVQLTDTITISSTVYQIVDSQPDAGMTWVQLRKAG